MKYSVELQRVGKGQWMASCDALGIAAGGPSPEKAMEHFGASLQLHMETFGHDGLYEHLTPLVTRHPNIRFEQPSVGGVPTWVLKGRQIAGETVEDMMDDYELTEEQVRAAMEYEQSGYLTSEQRKKRNEWFAATSEVIGRVYDL